MKNLKSTAKRSVDVVAASDVTLPWELPRYSNWLAVAKVNKKVHRALNEGLAGLDIEVAHLDILATIYRYPRISQRQLAEKLLVGRSNMSMLLPQMEKNGWIQREPDEGDKRLKRLSLTPDGVRLAERALQVQMRLVFHTFNALTEEECELIGTLMNRIENYLDENPLPVS